MSEGLAQGDERVLCDGDIRIIGNCNRRLRKSFDKAQSAAVYSFPSDDNGLTAYAIVIAFSNGFALGTQSTAVRIDISEETTISPAYTSGA